MILFDLLNTIDKTKFRKTLTECLVPEKDHDDYVSFIDTLLALKPLPSSDLLCLRKDEDYEFEAVVKNAKGQFAIDFVEWEEALGYQIDEHSLSWVSHEEFAFHVLFDLSFDGFHRETRDNQIQEMLNRIEEFEKSEPQ